MQFLEMKGCVLKLDRGKERSPGLPGEMSLWLCSLQDKGVWRDPVPLFEGLSKCKCSFGGGGLHGQKNLGNSKY